jgi:hypothetical protein
MCAWFYLSPHLKPFQHSSNFQILLPLTSWWLIYLTTLTCGKKKQGYHIECLPFVLLSLYIISLLQITTDDYNQNDLQSKTSVPTLAKLTSNQQPNANQSPCCHALTYFGIKVFNCLPADIKELSDDIKSFKNALKRFFHLHSFYSVEEYFNYFNYNKMNWTKFIGFNCFYDSDRFYQYYVLIVLLYVMCVRSIL